MVPLKGFSKQVWVPASFLFSCEAPPAVRQKHRGPVGLNAALLAFVSEYVSSNKNYSFRLPLDKDQTGSGDSAIEPDWIHFLRSAGYGNDPCLESLLNPRSSSAS